MRPSVKVGIVVLGLIVAGIIAWLAVEIQQRISLVPAAERAGGMYAFGDFLLGLAVFGVAALLPIGLGLYWLRPVRTFWSVVAWLAIVWGLTGLVAVAVNHGAGATTNGWIFLAHARFGLMPLAALVLLAGAVFAPLPRNRWPLAVAALADGLIFAVVVTLKFFWS